MPQGFFITFEGLDGSGKTTQLKRLAAWLQARGHSVVCTRQPGGTALGDRVRSLLLDSRLDAETGGVAPMAELALMFADRAQSIEQVILPALAAGKIVLCERYTDSTEAYQSGGRGIPFATVQTMHQLICKGLQPDLTLLLLPSLQSSLARARRRNDKALHQKGADENRFEREGDAFYTRVYQAYRAIAAREPQRVAAIEDDASIEDVQQSVRSIVAERLGNK